MKNLKLDELRTIAKDVLFENQVSARGRPDGVDNIRHMIHHRPAPIDKEGNTDIPDEETFEVPLVADDFVEGGYIGFDKRNPNARKNIEGYMPDNKRELSTYFVSRMNDFEHSEIDQDVISKIYNTVNKILDKV